MLCHGEVNDSFAKTKHASKGHTCATCHGPSAKHSWSEDGSVAPDRALKTRGQADALCRSCHKKVEHKTVDISTRSCSSCHKPHVKRQAPTETETPPDG
jgi:nitrate/TMAO reductase-like tetraheme cytochrome c subunit